LGRKNLRGVFRVDKTLMNLNVDKASLFAGWWGFRKVCKMQYQSTHLTNIASMLILKTWRRYIGFKSRLKKPRFFLRG